jgi:hypothetical protein
MLWSLSGHNPETFPALTESALPSFWQKFKKHRSSNTEARNFMESFLRSWKTTERIVTPFIWQPSVIRAARTLNFGADDIAFQWEIRDRGFSYLMLGPHEAFNSGSYVMTTDDWKLLELAEDDGKLTLEERRSSRRSSGLCPDVPSDRMTTVRHMECVADKILIFSAGIRRHERDIISDRYSLTRPSPKNLLGHAGRAVPSASSHNLLWHTA